MSGSADRHNLPYPFGFKVMVDDDKSIKATVVEYSIRSELVLVRCNWFNNGALSDAWFELERLGSYIE